MNVIDALIKRDDESQNDYRMRCYLYKMSNPDISWEALAEFMNSQLGESHVESTYRKQSKSWLSDYVPSENAEVGNSYINDLNTLLLEIKKAKVKLSDERNQNQAYVRKLAREETLLEIAKEVATKVSSKKIFTPTYLPLIKSKLQRVGIVCLSDWHYGMEVDNYFNKYNPEICVKRLQKLKDEIISKCIELGVTKLYIVNLSDLVSGRIHTTLRIENRYDAITQVIHVSEILSEFLTDLSEYFDIEYRDCLDNHSRLEPNKKESLELESLARIIPWYMEERLKDNDRIKILYNTYADDIISFEVFDYNVVAVHGHKDTPAKIISNMIAATRRRNDLVLSAHLHHFSADEENECVRVSNGSLMGVDTHAQDLRLTSKPSQNLIVANPNNVTEFICKINL